MQFYASAALGEGSQGVEANIAKLLWAPWHQRLGELAVDVMGEAALRSAVRSLRHRGDVPPGQPGDHA